MRIRQGFVSNSSSSSFIIAFDPDIDEIILDSKEFTEEEYEKYFSYKSEYAKCTKDEFREILKDIGRDTDIELLSQTWEDGEYLQRGASIVQILKDLAELHSDWGGIDVDAASEAIEKGYVFAQGSLGYSGEATEGSEYLVTVGLQPEDGLIIISQPS